MSYPFDSISDFIFVENQIIKSDIILIPGSDCKELMIHASKLYHDGFAPLILPSGRYNKNLPHYPSEWEFLKEIGIENGIPQDVILKEDMAANTFENAIFSLEVIRKKSLDIKSAIIISKDYHSRRALLTFQTIFPNNISFSINTVNDYKNITKDNWFLSQDKIDVVMGEVVKIGQYFRYEIPNLY